MNLLVIAFHYFSPIEDSSSKLYPISKKRFVNQLELLSRKYTFVSQDQIKNALDCNQSLPEFSCLLTFDDGLKSQFNIAWPILKEKGIPGVFFVNTEPLYCNKASTTHKMHWLRDKIEFNEFKKMMIDWLIQRGISTNQLGQKDIKHKSIQQYPYDVEEVSVFKYFLNFILEHEHLNEVIDSLFKSYIKNEEEFCRMFYMNKEECRVLSENNLLGTHGHQHKSFESQPINVLQNDLQQSIDLLGKLANKEINTISYPFGGRFLESEKAKKMIKEVGIKIGFVNTKQINDSLENCLFLSRFNTNDVPGGNSPLFDLDV